MWFTYFVVYDPAHLMGWRLCQIRGSTMTHCAWRVALLYISLIGKIIDFGPKRDIRNQFLYIIEFYIRHLAAPTLSYRTLFFVTVKISSFDLSVRRYGKLSIASYWGFQNTAYIVAIFIYSRISKNQISSTSSVSRISWCVIDTYYVVHHVSNNSLLMSP